MLKSSVLCACVSDKMAYTLNDYLMFVGTSVFIILILWDIKMAYKRAHWFPGNAMVLCGLIVQLVSYLDVQNINSSGKPKEKRLSSDIHNQLLIDTRRLALYVFMGYLVPFMANRNKWLYIAAALVSLSMHIGSEFYTYTVFYATDMSESAKQVMAMQIGAWLIASGPAILVLMLGFGILLFWAVSYSRFARDGFSVRIPRILPPIENKELSWAICKEEILKTWVVCRVCQPEYVLVRSPFSTAVALTTTFYVAFLGAKTLFLKSLLNDRLPLFTFQCVFIFIGWIVVLYRCFKSLFLFKNIRKDERMFLCSVWRRCRLLVGIVLSTGVRQIVAILVILFLQLPKNVGISAILSSRLPRVSKRSLSRWVLDLLIGGIVFIIVCPLLCFLVLLLLSLGILWLFVLFIFLISLWVVLWLSVSCWVVLCLVLSNTCKTYKEDLSGEQKNFIKYCADLRMPSEDPERLWMDNKRSFDRVKDTLDKAYKEGQKYEELIEVIKKYLPEHPDENYLKKLEEFQNLKELEKFRLERVKNYFPYLKEPFWKMTALVLVDIICYVVRSSAVSLDWEQLLRAAKAYDQAEMLLNFVDCPEINMDILDPSNAESFVVSYAAESKTVLLTLTAFKYMFQETQKINVGGMVNYIKKSSEKAQKTLKYAKLLPENPPVVEDSFDEARCAEWSSVGPDYCLYQVCQYILNQQYDNPKDLIDRLISLLEDIIAACILSEESRELLLKRIRDWSTEKKILEALPLAGRTFGVLDASRNHHQVIV